MNNLEDCTVRLIGVLISFIMVAIIDLVYGSYFRPDQLGVIMTGAVAIGTLIMSLFFILKYQNINLRMVGVAYCFGLLVVLRPNSYTMGFLTIASYIGAQCVFKVSNKEIPIFKAYTLRNITGSILGGIFIGGFLAYIDLVISYDVIWQISIEHVLAAATKAIRPGIWEEINFRFFVYAVCLYLCGGNIATKMQYVFTFILMLIPHVVIHFPIALSEMTPYVFMIELVKLTFLFGVPLTLIQLKRDLMTAIIAHFTLDLVIFTFIIN